MSVFFQSPFIGEVNVTSHLPIFPPSNLLSFSPLFIGAMVVTASERHLQTRSRCFQSPFHRGNGCNSTLFSPKTSPFTFSPLFIGAMVVTIPSHDRRGIMYITFSPLFIGAMVVTASERHLQTRSRCFQSPFHRGNGCNSHCGRWRDYPNGFQSPIDRGNGCNPTSVS